MRSIARSVERPRLRSEPGGRACRSAARRLRCAPQGGSGRRAREGWHRHRPRHRGAVVVRTDVDVVHVEQDAAIGGLCDRDDELGFRPSNPRCRRDRTRRFRARCVDPRCSWTRRYARCDMRATASSVYGSGIRSWRLCASTPVQQRWSEIQRGFDALGQSPQDASRYSPSSGSTEPMLSETPCMTSGAKDP